MQKEVKEVSSNSDNNLDELCDRVFRNPPQDECTWCLYLDESIVKEIPESEHTMYIFEILVQILFGGIKILFGTNDSGKISLGSLTEADFELLRDYYKMMEYDIKMEIYDLDSISQDTRKFDPSDFSTVHFKFMKEIEGQQMYVDIHFTDYEPQTLVPLHTEINNNLADEEDLDYWY